MNWLWVILVVATIAGVLGYFSEQNKEKKGEAAVESAMVGGIGCGYLILQILIGLAGLWFLIKLAGWLFS